MRSSKSLANLFVWNVGILLLLSSPIWMPLLLAWMSLNHLDFAKKVPLIGQWSIRLARYPYLNYLRPGLNGRKDCHVYDEILLYRGKPNSICRFSGLEFDTTISHNSFGVRSLESSLISPATIVIGDSHAMGWGVEEHERFSDLLPAQFQPVLNLSVSSYGTARELRLLDLYASEYPESYKEASLVVLQYGVNDFGENISTGSVKYKTNRSEESLSLGEVYVGYEELFGAVGPAQLRQTLNHWYAWAAVKVSRGLGIPGVLPLEWSYDAFAIPYPDHGDPFVMSFAPYSELLHGKTLAIFVSSDHGFYNESAFSHLLARRRQLKNILPGTIIVWIDFSSVCSDNCYYDFDDHLRPLGHKRLAELIESTVSAL